MSRDDRDIKYLLIVTKFPELHQIPNFEAQYKENVEYVHTHLETRGHNNLLKWWHQVHSNKPLWWRMILVTGVVLVVMFAFV